MRSSHTSHAWGSLMALVVCVALVLVGGTSPAMAAGGSGDGRAPVLGSFALGEQLDATIDPATGALSIEAGVVGLPLVWDSRLVGVDRFGLGAGWAIGGIQFVDIEGGVRVVAGHGEVYEADASAPSGLHAYPDDDVVFTRAAGTLPGRADGLLGAREYAFTLTVLGGMREYFSATGDPLSSVDRFGQRNDWEWADDHRLTRVIDADGVIAALDWGDGSRVEVVRSAGAATHPDRTVLRGSIERSESGDGVAAIIDAGGARAEFEAGDGGLVRAVRGATGVLSEVGWQSLADGGLAVQQMRLRDESTGRSLGERRWSLRSGSVSGWPGHEPGLAGTAAAGPRRTELGDGVTRIVGDYDPQGRLTRKTLGVASPAGQAVLQEERLEYPRQGDSPHPERLTVTHRDPQTGAARTVEERYEFDARGRMTERTAIDGSVTLTSYDDSVGATGVQIGLVVSERTHAPDGLIAEVRHEPNAERTAVVATESFTGLAGSLERVAREERSVDADGRVTELREFEQGGGGTPRVTRWQRTPDIAAGRVLVLETVAATSPVAVTTTEVTDLVLGAPVASTDAVGRVTTTEYDDAGRPTRRVSPGGLVATTQYRAGPRGGAVAVTETGADGVAVTEERDGLGRVARVTDTLATIGDTSAVPVEGHVRVRETRTYPEPNVVEVTDAWGATSRSRTDVLGRVVEAVAPNGLAEVTEYDDVRHTRTTGLTPTGRLADAEQVTVEQLDALGEVVSTSGGRADDRPVPTTSAITDGFGRTESAVEAATETAFDFDAYGNPQRVSIGPRADMATDEAGGAVIDAERRFDAFGTSIEKVVSDSAVSRSGGSRTVDELGRTAAVTDQRRRTTTYAYEADGLVSLIVDGAGRRTANGYDPVTRLLTSTIVTSPLGEALHTAYEHDPATGAVTAVFDPRDRPGTVITYTYDGHGNVTSVTYPDGGRVRHAFDEHGRKRSTTDVAGATTTFGYDEAGTLAGAVQVDRHGRELARVAYEIDEYGRTDRVVHGNGVVTDVTFTSVSEIETEVTTGPDGEVQTRREYEYDERGNLVRRVDRVADVGGAAPTSTAAEYGYDVHDRLVHSAVHEGPDHDSPVLRESSYELTGPGDIATETVTERPGRADARQTVRRFEYDDAGALVTIRTADADGTRTQSLSYDESGSLRQTSDGRRIEYDAAGRPVMQIAADGTPSRTSYWATGQPRATTSEADDEASTVVRYWDGSTLANDAHPDAGGIASYLLGTARHARSIQLDDPDQPSITSYAGFDRHGSVTASTDEAGALTAAYAYADYGTPAARDGDARSAGVSGARASDELTRNPFGFAGEYTDPDGTQFLTERTYDPELMAFTTPDHAERHNRYNFADLNPITRIDPTGQTPQIDGGTVLAGLGIAGAVIGFIASIATGGALGPLIGNGLFGLFDVGVAIAMEVDRANPGAISEQGKLTLGGVAFVAGLAAFVAPWFLGGVPPARGKAGRLADRTDEQWIALRDYDSHADFVTSHGQRAQLVAMFPEIPKIQTIMMYFTRFVSNRLSASISQTDKGIVNLDPTLESLKHILTLRFPNTAHAVAKVWRVGVTAQWPNGRYVLPADVTRRIIAYAQDSAAYLHSSEGVAQLFRHEIGVLRKDARPRFVGSVAMLIDEISVAEQDLRAADLIW